MDCSLPGSSVHGDSPGKNNGVGCHALLQGSSQSRDWTQVSHIAGGFFTISATREAPLSTKAKYVYVLCPNYSTPGYSISVNQFSSVTQSCPNLCNPMDYSTPGFPVHHQLPELAQTHDHGVGDAIQPSHPLSSPSPPAFNLSQHQGLFQWVIKKFEKWQVQEGFSNLPLKQIIRPSCERYPPYSPGKEHPYLQRGATDAKGNLNDKALHFAQFSTFIHFLFCPITFSQ